MTQSDEATGPTPEEIAERAHRVDRATRGALAAILALEAVIVLLVPRTIAFTTGLGPVRTTILGALALLLVAGAAVTRRSWGVGVGSVLQIAFTATGILIVTMFVVGAIFATIWVRVLMFRHEIVGTSGGFRMLIE